MQPACLATDSSHNIATALEEKIPEDVSCSLVQSLYSSRGDLKAGYIGAIVGEFIFMQLRAPRAMPESDLPRTPTRKQLGWVKFLGSRGTVI